MKRILGLDLGTNSIGWAQIQLDFKNKQGKIDGLGSRIIPMDAAEMGKFDSGQSISQTADRTGYRGTRRLYQRENLRRERLHRVLNTLKMLPEHYSDSIDFERKLGQFKPNTEVKLPYKKKEDGKFSFIFQKSFMEMVDVFKSHGHTENIPHDWSIYYLRKKALKHKIEKEELAWILLNFNQKRGYYQLRGEDEADKNKKFEQLKVENVIDSGQKVKGNILYNVTFENGWEYDSQITKKEEWIGKTKEFIVTTSTRKDGTIKRSFKKVNSEEDWLAIKEKTQNEVDAFNSSNETCGIGSYIFDELLKEPSQKIRGKLVKTIERKYYKEELEKILETQIEFHPKIFNDNYLKQCIEELYPRNEAHQNILLAKDFKHFFVNDIIFYQRPLKSKKSSISDCPYEARFYKKDDELLKQPLKCIPKSNPIYQEFRLWQFIHNLKIYQKEGEIEGKPAIDIDVTTQILSNDEAYSILFDRLNKAKEINQKQFLAIFKLKETTHRWNFPEDKKYPCNDTRAQISNRLGKVDKVKVDEFLTPNLLHHLWHLIYSVTDKKEYEKALKTFAKKNNLPVDNFIENFKRFPPFESAYGAYSEKAIKRLLPLMRIGKYWNLSHISEDVKTRIESIVTRLNEINYNIDKIDEISDDDVPKRLLKSFAKSKNRENPLKGLNTYQACYAVYNRHSEIGDIVQWKQPEDISNYLNNFKQHSLRNPIVEKLILETLRVVKDIWTTYGEKEVVNGKEQYKPLFDEIHLELGREMKNDKATRKRISESNTERENTNERIKAVLEELKADPNVTDDVRPYSPSHQEILKIYEDGLFSSLKEVDDSIEKIRKKNKPTRTEIVKYKLWLEQGYISPYTGKVIPLTKLFSTDYQIEHIIPQSRYFDNSMNNKIICESAVNEEKDNKTAYEFLKDRGGSVIDLGHGKTVKLFTIENYENHCQTYFRKNKSKLERLLSEDIPEGFINRQLNDSRYISKVVKGLLSNIVREDGELEATSKNLVPVTGAITSKLKNDWGLNDKWNEIIAPRFMRLNELTKTEDFGYWDKNINAFRIQVPKELERNFNKKRIDHRHHALDALVIACTTKDHINYITSLNTARNNHKLVSKLRATKTITDNKGKVRTVAKEYHKPWKEFAAEAKTTLEKTVVSFKKNNRVINKTNNKTRQWANVNGNFKKKLIPQTKGQNWAIRKPMHDPMPYGEIKMQFDVLDISNSLSKVEFILDSYVQESVQEVINLKEGKIGVIKDYLKKNPIKNTLGHPISKTRYKIDNVKYGKRQSINKLAYDGLNTLLAVIDKNGLNSDDAKEAILKGVESVQKTIWKVGDLQLQLDLEKHLLKYTAKKKISIALFSVNGIEQFNKERINSGKHPVNNIRFVESSEKRWPLGQSLGSHHKMMEATDGTNLFFNIYWNEKKKKRAFETVPLNEVIAHQKQVAVLPKENRRDAPIDNSKGEFVFSLSPNNLVFVPREEEIANPQLVDFENMSKDQINRIYKMVSCTGAECHFIPCQSAYEIMKNENGTNSKSERIQLEDYLDDKNKPMMIKNVCWKIEANRLGFIRKI